MSQWLPNEDPPRTILDSALWARIAARPEYVGAMRAIRAVAAALSQRTSSVAPEYTDHSVAHMDSLWQVTDQVLTLEEVNRISPGEAFLLGSSFYVHDLGMALPVTTAGKEQIKNSEAYRIARARFAKLSPSDDGKAAELALREATRELHAKKALEIATKPLPGLDTYLIEDSDLRSRWGNLVGLVSESHHWSLSEVERSLGSRGVIPGPDGDAIDLAYVASVLRIVDFAHINRSRAPQIERLLRPELPRQSEVHWNAQAKVTGPFRDGDLLVFGCTEPIADTDAWWLFHDLALGLDAEIKGVQDYLRSRTVSAERFSLQGVKGVEDPAVFNRFVRLPEQVVPIDIRVQPDSMERVVELLGGRHIYGDDRLAPIRELIQNARDAIELRASLDQAHDRPSAPGRITISLERTADNCVLKVADNGVGMTRGVVRRHLVAVGSDFWNSAEFYRQFSKAVDAGFRPIGRFGIGFLSVFMLGNHVEVETETAGGNRTLLILEGVGRRGDLSETPSLGQAGTEVRIVLKTGVEELTKNLAAIVRARAPMLSVPMSIKVAYGSLSSKEVVEPGWWKRIDETSLFSFISSWPRVAKLGTDEENPHARHRRDFEEDYFYSRLAGADFGGQWSVKGWPSQKPSYLTETERIISSGGEGSYGVLRCSRGIAIDRVPVADLSGIVDVGAADLTVSRESIAGPEARHAAMRANERFGDKLISDVRPTVIEKANELQSYGMLPGRINFLRGLTQFYGHELLDRTELPWIPVTEPPGNIIHRSKAQVVDALKGQRHVLIAIGISAGGAYSAASPHVPQAELRRTLVIAIPKEEVSVDYSVKGKLEHNGTGNPLTGPLDSVLEQAGHDEAQLILTEFLVKCVAEAWATSSEELRAQDWRLDYKENVLWADLSRP